MVLEINFEDIKELLDMKMDPIVKNVRELKEDSKKIVDLLENQAAHEESIKRLWIENDKCGDSRKHIYSKIEEVKEKIENVKEKGNKKLWEIAKMFIIAGLSAFGVSYFG